MKRVFGLLALGVLLFTAGCEVEAPYGGSYGVYGEYGYPTYYGGYSNPYYHHYHPYDRDHYWDRGGHFEQHRWHGDHGWGHHDRD